MEEPRDFPGRLRHDVPSWVKAGAVFHVRVRVAPEQATPLTDTKLGADLITAVRRYHDLGRWWCRLVVLMPDHLHALVSFPENEAGMASAVRDWKRGTARFQGVRWQSNFFDHRLRSEAEADEAWVYFGENPVVKGLVGRAEDWPWRWSPFDQAH
jgi:REP element-mobilizing transposase RayT